MKAVAQATPTEAAHDADSILKQRGPSESRDSRSSGPEPFARSGSRFGVDVGPVGDRFELEAEQMADQVMTSAGPQVEFGGIAVVPPASATAASSTSSTGAQPSTSLAPRSVPAPREPAAEATEAEPETEVDEETVPESQRRLTAGAPPPPPPDDPPESTSHGVTLRTGGSPLPPALRAFYELRFGRDFSRVRIHAGRDARRWCERFGALAFTFGSHVWTSVPLTRRPSRVLAHELAHVVQQRQPPLRPESSLGTTPAPGPGPERVQRIAIIERFPFFSPKDMTGTDIHNLLEKEAPSNVMTEVGIPNANRLEANVGLRGRADYYKASHRIGITFKDDKTGEPSNMNTKHKPQPTVKGKGTAKVIEGLARAPTDIALGELKPAAKDPIDDGMAQLGHYERGFEIVTKGAEFWAKKHQGITSPWKITPSRLSEREIDYNKKFDYDPAAPKADRDLVVKKVTLDSTRSLENQERYDLKTIFDPQKHGLTLKGGLYAGHLKNGLFVYFARPRKQDVDKIVNDPKLRQGKKSAMTLAELTQREIVAPLLQPPTKQKVAPYPLPPPRRPLSSSRESPRVRRKPKKEARFKLVDPFDKARKKQWDDARTNLKKQTASGDGEKTLQKLEFLELAYRAEERLDKVKGPAKKSTLPPKKDLDVQLRTDAVPPTGAKAGTKGSGKGTSKTKPRSLADMASWISAWSSKPAAVIGTFRQKFGGGLVAVGTKLADVRENLRKKAKSSIGGKKGTGIASIILRALGRALAGILGVVVPRTLGLVYDTVRDGAKTTFEKELDLDPATLLDETGLKKTFDPLQAKAEELEQQAKTLIEGIEAQYEKDLKPWIEKVKALDSTALRVILEIGMIIAQCASPPGWGCAKLLLRRASLAVADSVLCVEWVQRQIAAMIAGIPGLDTISETLAKLVLKTLRDFVPTRLKPIFPDPKTKAPPVTSSDIEPDQEGCEGFGDKGGAGSGDVKDGGAGARALRDLIKKLGKDRSQQLGEMVEKAGIRDQTPLKPEQAKDIGKHIDDNGITAEQMKDFLGGKADPAVKKLMDMLEKIERQEVIDQAVKKFKKGDFDPLFDHLGRKRIVWRIVGEAAQGMSKHRTLIVQKDGAQAVGVANVEFGPCKDGKVKIKVIDPDLRDRNGDPIHIPLAPHELDGELVLQQCPGSKGGGQGGGGQGGGGQGGGGQGGGKSDGGGQGDGGQPPTGGEGERKGGRGDKPDGAGGPGGSRGGRAGRPDANGGQGQQDRDDGGGGESSDGKERGGGRDRGGQEGGGREPDREAEEFGPGIQGLPNRGEGDREAEEEPPFGGPV